ncbi:MAG: hypothetical protein WBC82_10240 [Dehalococcoidia bacterium]
MEVSEDPNTGYFVLIISKGICEKWYRKWARINFAEKMWRVKCSKDEVSEAVSRFLAEEVLD